MSLTIILGIEKKKKLFPLMYLFSLFSFSFVPFPIFFFLGGITRLCTYYRDRWVFFSLFFSLFFFNPFFFFFSFFLLFFLPLFQTGVCTMCTSIITCDFCCMLIWLGSARDFSRGLMFCSFFCFCFLGTRILDPAY